MDEDRVMTILTKLSGENTALKMMCATLIGEVALTYGERRHEKLDHLLEGMEGVMTGLLARTGDEAMAQSSLKAFLEVREMTERTFPK